MRKFRAALAVFASIFVLAACGGGSHVKTKAPASLIGNWHQTNGTEFSASISAGSIQINWVSQDTSVIYWLGTFNTDKSPMSYFKVRSLGDQDAMAESILASQSKTKDFTYENGDLSYKFTIAGITSVIHLSK